MNTVEEIKAVLNLCGTPEEYTFTIVRRTPLPVLQIPGDHRGPDVCIPRKSEQASWLDSLSEYMTPCWDCQWKFISMKACEDFTRQLRDQNREFTLK